MVSGVLYMLAGMDVWSLFSQAISNMNDSANSQYYQALNGINSIQAQSIDPSDTGAYNMTLYGMSTIHYIQSMIVSNISDMKGLVEQALAGSGMASPGPPSNLSTPNMDPVSTLTAAVGNISPSHDLLTDLMLIIIGIAIGALIFNRK
jgi:hypothetical protein